MSGKCHRKCPGVPVKCPGIDRLLHDLGQKSMSGIFNCPEFVLKINVRNFGCPEFALKINVRIFCCPEFVLKIDIWNFDRPEFVLRPMSEMSDCS